MGTDNKYEIEQLIHMKLLRVWLLVTSQVLVLCYEFVMDIQVDA